MCCLNQKLLLLILLVLVSGLTRVKKKTFKLRAQKKPLRIIGGTDAPNSKYPFVARLEVWESRLIEVDGVLMRAYKPYHSCTCSILTPEWTLTAAHCLEPLPDPKDMRHMLRYGSDDPSVNASAAEVLKLIRHPGYRMDDIMGHVSLIINDIGLIKTTPIDIPKYGRISAVDFLSLVGQKALALGFGVTNATLFKGVYILDTTLRLHKPLQALDVMIRRCSQYEQSLVQITPPICLSHLCGVSSSICDGDSGGPLLHESGIIGVNSVGVGSDCEFIADRLRSNLVGIITAASPLLDWIAMTISEKERPSNDTTQIK